MTNYTPTNRREFRTKQGSLAAKVTDEFNDIDNGFVKVAKVALKAGVANAFALAWQNPESVPIIVQRLDIDITTAGGTATAVLNAGTSASASTTSDNLIDGADANAATVYNNITDIGSNGKTVQKMDELGGTTDYLTIQILTAAASALAGYAYITYVPVYTA